MITVAVDLGGTHTRVGRFPRAAARGFTRAARFRTHPDYDAQLAELVAAVSAIPGRPAAAVGVSFGGRLDPTGRSVAVCLNLRDYEGRALADDLESALARPVRLAHDATCGLLGEHAHGALRGADRCAYVTLSTGVGCAVRLGSGPHAVTLTTEAGHQLLGSDGSQLPCSCGQRGCLETRTGGRALERRLGAPLAEVHDPAFWRGYAAALGRGLANLALVAGVERVVLGGAIALRRPELWPLLRESLAAELTYRPLTVDPARLGEDAPLVGAAVLVATPEDAILH